MFGIYMFMGAFKQVPREVIEAARMEIVSRGGDRPDLKLLADYLRLRAEKYDVIGRLMQSRRAFILSGYVTARNARPLSEELSSKFDVAVELTAPGPDEDVPVVLKNNPFSTPVESVVESYSLPGRHEIDPTTIMSFFYYILFGMMLSDAGYGLVMTIACAVVILKYKNMEPGIGKMVKMFFWCGLSTTFWGFMFGSFFGDAVAVISSTFFHSDLALRPIWFEPVSEPIRLLTFSFLIGIIHLFVGLGLKFYQYAREGKYYDAVCDVVFWYLLVGGGIVYLLTMPMIRTGISYFQLRHRLDEARRTNQELMAVQEDLQKQIEDLEDPSVIERLAREELGLVKPGESVVIPSIPNDEVPESEGVRPGEQLH